MTTLIERLSNPAIQSFIKDNAQSDVSALALKKPPQSDWPYPEILNQIKSHQKAVKKLPHWAETTGIIYPAPNVIEQASSAATAFYKASLCKGETFADLTGGAGIDTAAFAQNFTNGHCIEIDEDTATLLAHNLKLLGAETVKVTHKSAEQALNTLLRADLIFIDPARRDGQTKGKILLSDCSPNIFDILPDIQKKTNILLLKTSPILDITQTLRDLPHVTHVHIVEYNAECKEILYHLDFTTPQTTPQIHACIINHNGQITAKHSFTPEEEAQTTPEYTTPLQYLYEPGPAAMKSGGFKTIANTYTLKKLHEHTHLYTASTLIDNFPGRRFEIIQTLPANAKKLPLTKANLAIRNFPATVETLKKQLKIKDGGAEYLFACTLSDNKKALLHVRKI